MRELKRGGLAAGGMADRRRDGAILPQWHEPLALLREASFVILARPGWALDWHTLPPEFRSLEANVVPAPLIDIRATDIRDRVRAGKSIDYLTPPAVADYIQRRGIYLPQR